MIKYTIDCDEKLNRAYQRMVEACDKICDEEGVDYGIGNLKVNMKFGDIGGVYCKGEFVVYREWVK